MFSGLIEYSGTVERIDPVPSGGATLTVLCEGASDEDVEKKDSIAINGVCLTAVEVNHRRIAFDVVPETLGRTTLGALRPGEVVNVEYALMLGDRIGGHFVYGHVDARAAVLRRTPEGQGERVRIETPALLRDFVAEKAFIGVDGVSLTVAACGDTWFELALIPETMRRTTLGRRPEGSMVNLEIDPFARYAVEAARRFLERPR